MTIIKLKMLKMQLLYEIQLNSLSKSLPLACRRFYTIHKDASPFFRAQYILARIFREKNISLSVIYSRALRYPICDQDVIHCIQRLVKKAIPPLCDDKYLVRLPKRIFRNLRSGSSWTMTDEPLPFLRYMWDCPDIPTLDLNYPDGYPLIRAVRAKFVPLIKFLLDHHASPESSDRLAVKVAIRKKALGILKLLVERSSVDPDNGSVNGNGERRKKRQKLAERVNLDAELLNVAIAAGASDIIYYLHEEKGVVPNLETIKTMLG